MRACAGATPGHHGIVSRRREDFDQHLKTVSRNCHPQIGKVWRRSRASGRAFALQSVWSPVVHVFMDLCSLRKSFVHFSLFFISSDAHAFIFGKALQSEV